MVIATFGQTSTEPVSVRRGLKQGCPLSSLLYMLYTAGLKRDLIDSGLGFVLRFQYDGSPQVWTLPELVFADYQKRRAYVTYWTHPQREREHGVGALGQPSFVPAQDVFERTADRCSIAPALDYLAFHRCPNTIQASSSAMMQHVFPADPISKGRPADQGRAIQGPRRRRERDGAMPPVACREKGILFASFEGFRFHAWNLKYGVLVSFYRADRKRRHLEPVAVCRRQQKEGYVTYWTHPQQELEHGMGALDQPSFVTAQNVLERTTDRCSIAPALGYVTYIGVRHDPSFFVCHDAAHVIPADRIQRTDLLTKAAPFSLRRCFGVRLGDTVAASSVVCPARFSRLFLSGSSETVAGIRRPSGGSVLPGGR
ncbi:hypothetical protein MRX96_028845 [Rhipicephalus microplus]